MHIIKNTPKTGAPSSSRRRRLLRRYGADDGVPELRRALEAKLRAENGLDGVEARPAGLGSAEGAVGRTGVRRGSLKMRSGRVFEGVLADYVCHAMRSIEVVSRHSPHQEHQKLCASCVSTTLPIFMIASQPLRRPR